MKTKTNNWKGFCATFAVAFGLAGVVFYCAFFALAPKLMSIIPNGPWKPLAGFVIYVLVAYFGGIGLPIAIACFGIAIAVTAFLND